MDDKLQLYLINFSALSFAVNKDSENVASTKKKITRSFTRVNVWNGNHLC